MPPSKRHSPTSSFKVLPPPPSTNWCHPAYCKNSNRLKNSTSVSSCLLMQINAYLYNLLHTSTSRSILWVGKVFLVQSHIAWRGEFHLMGEETVKWEQNSGQWKSTYEPLQTSKIEYTRLLQLPIWIPRLTGPMFICPILSKAFMYSDSYRLNLSLTTRATWDFR